MSLVESVSFRTRAELLAWLRKNHASKKELWVRMFKKGSGTQSIDWNDCVLATLAWGWIDGQRNSLDETSYLQRITPRRAKSTWSKKNCAHAEALISAGEMEPPGLAQVVAAQADGRFERAYAGQAEMVFPPEFLAELERHPAAKVAFDGLPRSRKFSIYFGLQNAKTEVTKQKRIAKALAELGGLKK